MVDTGERDRIEGHYTQREPQVAVLRRDHGQYTESAGRPGPGADLVGAYVGSERAGVEPLVRSSQVRSGKYAKAERGGLANYVTREHHDGAVKPGGDTDNPPAIVGISQVEEVCVLAWLRCWRSTWASAQAVVHPCIDGGIDVVTRSVRLCAGSPYASNM